MPSEILPDLPPRPAVDEPPPFLGAWSRVYIAVICYLALVIALLYWFARTFAA